VLASASNSLLEHEQASGLAKLPVAVFDATNVRYGAGISCSTWIDRGGKNPARGDLAEKFREGVSKEKDLGEFSGG